MDDLATIRGRLDDNFAAAEQFARDAVSVAKRTDSTGPDEGSVARAILQALMARGFNLTDAYRDA